MRLLVFLVALTLVVGCATVPQGIAPSAKPLVNAKGSTNKYKILGYGEGSASHFSLFGFIPFGRADIDEAIQNALRPLNGDNLINSHYYVTNTWLLIGYSTKITVKGDVIKYTGISSLNKTQKYQGKTEQNQEIKNKDTSISTVKKTAKKKKKSQFQIGKNYVGPSLGLDFTGPAVSFGANYEIGMNLQKLGVDASGMLGVGGIFRYWSYGKSIWGNSLTQTQMVIAAQGNYHILLDNEKLDPYVGLIIGLDFMSENYDYGYKWGDASSSSVGFVIGTTGGIRYWVSPQMAVNGRFSVGTNMDAMLDLGIDFKF